MRHHDAESIRAACEAALPAVLEHVGLPTDLTFERDDEGWVNVCFLSRDVVVRFNARDPELPKFHREQWAYHVLADRGFPVPRLLAHVDDRDVAPYPVLVAERLPGENLEATWDGLDAGQKRRLAAQAGQWLARLHRQPFSGFGEVYGGDRVSTQREWWAVWTGILLQRCDPLFDREERARFAAAIEGALPALDGVSESRFVHRDYHPGNLLHDGRDIVGLLDFEWSMASDPAVDRAEWSDLDEVTPGASAPFVEAYEAEFGEVEDDPLRVALYGVSSQLELCDVAHRFLTRPEADAYRDTAWRLLGQLEERL